ncbi:MAG: tetratricopeptide repeat protein [Humidesulfovibrio sp.]|nr:tetratricopeptide repeat protein [Humidesulfovibrio sp.]
MNKRLQIATVMSCFVLLFFPGCAPSPEELVKRAEQAKQRGDYMTAERLFRRAAIHGDVQAQSSLGQLLNGELGLELARQKSVKWFTIAANNGDAVAQYNLGMMYENGEGVGCDHLQAYIWVSLAAIRGNQDAKRECDAMKQKLSPNDLATVQEFIKRWSPKAMDVKKVLHAKPL